MKKIVLFCLVSIGLVFVYFKSISDAQYRYVYSILEKIPAEEKCFLDYFFRNLILIDSGSIVLNGSKPVAMLSFLESTYYPSTIHWKGFRRTHLFKKGFEI